jgi:hypothetical protein
MGTLRELEGSKNVHMLITSSTAVEMYVYDKLKEQCHASLESVLTVNSKSSFSEMLELVGMQSYLSDKWLFVIEYSKVKASIKANVGIFESEEAKFLIKVNTYRDFKEFKELLPSVNDLYLSFIRRNEVMYLLSKYNLSQKDIDFVAKSYSREPEKVFLFKKELDNGLVVNYQRDIVKLLGESTGSITSYALALLRDFPTTEKGFKTVCRNRIKTGKDLCEAYGVSSFKNFLMATIKDFIYIKELYMQGTIYNSIRDLPEVFDEKKLSKYNVYLRTLVNDISYSRLVSLYSKLRESGRWVRNSDLLMFIYDYYKVEVV